MGDLDTKPGQAAANILDKTIKWTDKFYDLGPDYILKMIKANNSNGIVYIEFHYYQIGLTNEWLRNISNKIGNPLTVRREILLQRLHGSDLSPYPREDIEYITSTMQKPIDEIYVLGYYKFDIYSELKRTVPYLVGVDCSTGTSSDNNAITIIDPYTVRPVAEFSSPYIGETEYENVLKALVKDVIPRAIVIIERNSVGDGIIDHLLSDGTIANNLYFDKDRDLVQAKMRDAETVESMLIAKSRIKTYYGVYTHGKSREDMFSILSRRINENKDDFVTNNVICDITGLVRTSSGKIEARPGGHDDSIMSYLIAMYVYYHGNNLAAFGFYKTDLYDGREENSGLNRPNISDILPAEIVDKIQKDEEIEKEMDYDRVFREALEESQRSSRRLAQSKVIRSNNYYDNTPAELINETDDSTDYGDIDLGMFDSLNGF